MGPVDDELYRHRCQNETHGQGDGQGARCAHPLEDDVGVERIVKTIVDGDVVSTLAGGMLQLSDIQVELAAIS
ncbi:MAG: hypothetical protein R6U10_05495 [Thermoplasmatota archaeon]